MLRVALKNLLFPSYCLRCLTKTYRLLDLCQACESELPWNYHYCYRCAQPLPEEAQVTYCARCLHQKQLFQQSYSAFLYKAPIEQWIHQIKFGANLSRCQLLSELLVTYLHSQGAPLPQALLPVPLHPKRIQERGFNQSVEIAKIIAKKFNLPILIDEIERIKHTPAQAQLSKKQRHENLKNAFVLIKPLKYSDIAIIDDVITTGVTVHQLSKVLQKSGIARITVWSLARTP